MPYPCPRTPQTTRVRFWSLTGTPPAPLNTEHQGREIQRLRFRSSVDDYFRVNSLDALSPGVVSPDESSVLIAITRRSPFGTDRAVCSREYPTGMVRRRSSGRTIMDADHANARHDRRSALRGRRFPTSSNGRHPTVTIARSSVMRGCLFCGSVVQHSVYSDARRGSCACVVLRLGTDRITRRMLLGALALQGIHAGVASPRRTPAHPLSRCLAVRAPRVSAPVSIKIQGH